MKRSHIAIAVGAAAVGILVLVLLYGGSDDPRPTPPADSGALPERPVASPGDRNGHAPQPKEANTDAPVTWDELDAALRKKRGPDRPAHLAEGQCRDDSHCSKAGGLLRCDTANGQCKEPTICVADEDCLGVRVCQRGRCADELQGCRAADCRPGHCDHGAGECEYNPCKTDKDCAGNRRCDPSRRGECKDCLDDADCGNGKGCKQGFCKKPDHCVGIGACPPNHVCDQLETGNCIPSRCKPDPNEPNNQPEAATPLAPASPLAGELCPAADESDYYLLDVARGEGFVVSVSSDRNKAFLEIRLYNAKGEDVGRFGDWERQGYMEAVMAKVPADGPYYARVKFTQGVPTAYVVQWTPVPDGFCHDDPFEPNDRLEDAADLANGRTWDMRLCGRDDDWFVHGTTAGKEVEVRVSQRESTPVPVVELFDDRSMRRVAIDDSSDSEKRLIFKGTHDGNLFVRISQDDPDGDTDYAIHFVPR
jgi:hypothetical protein